MTASFRSSMTASALTLAAGLSLLFAAPAHAISADDGQGETIPAPIDAASPDSKDADAGTLALPSLVPVADSEHPADPDSQAALLQYPHPHRS